MKEQEKMKEKNLFFTVSQTPVQVLDILIAAWFLCLVLNGIYQWIMKEITVLTRKIIIENIITNYN